MKIMMMKNIIRSVSQRTGLHVGGLENYSKTKTTDVLVVQHKLTTYLPGRYLILRIDLMGTSGKLSR
jgi:hypothetical protein